MDYKDEIWNNVEKMYSELKSIRRIQRELKLGTRLIKRFLIERKMFDGEYGRIPCEKNVINVGDRFGRWTVLNPNARDEDRYMIEVKCECGTTALIRQKNLETGRSKGCVNCKFKSNYPTFRKSSSNPDVTLKGLSPSWLSSINNNKERGIYRTIEVSIDSFDLLSQLEKQNSRCAYTGEYLNVLGVSKSKSNASVDRINSLLDYTVDNIQWVSKNVNRMKNAFSDKEFLDTCVKVYNFRHGNPEPSSSNIK